MDSVPIVCLTGQVPTHLIGNDAFQEADTTGITRPCTKHNYLVKDVNDLARVMHEAFYVARTGRPGPVVVDLPKDVLFATGTYVPPEEVGARKTYRPQTVPDPARIEEAAELIAEAEAAALLWRRRHHQFGPARLRAVRRAGEEDRLSVHADADGAGRLSRPRTSSISASSACTARYESNNAMHDCDVMICVGARFDDRVTGRLNAFSPGSKKIHIDIDPSSINKNVRVDVPVLGDAAQVLDGAARRA